MKYMTNRRLSFKYAFQGITYLLQTQPNARIHLAATSVVILISAWLNINKLSGYSSLQQLALSGWQKDSIPASKRLSTWRHQNFTPGKNRQGYGSCFSINFIHNRSANRNNYSRSPIVDKNYGMVSLITIPSATINSIQS